MRGAQISLRAGCKVNMGLRITGVRADGYHTLDSLFWPLREPYDLLYCQIVNATGLTVECIAQDIDPVHNTLTRAYGELTQTAGRAPGVHVTLEKGIPTGAGLGGGSADAAILLLWLNTQLPTPLDAVALHEVAARTGADVPFFLYNIPCRVRGIGDRITPWPHHPFTGMHLTLVCPPVSVSTSWAYTEWEAAHSDKFFSKDLTTSRADANDLDSCLACVVNDFEEVVFAVYPALRTLKEDLLQRGAAAAVMSGSGGSLAALFRSPDTARQTADSMKERGLRVYSTAL